MHLGSKSKECLRSHIIVARAEGEGDNYMRSQTFFTYSRGSYTNFLHEERKMRRLFFARRAYSMHFTRRVEKRLLKKYIQNSPSNGSFTLYGTDNLDRESKNFINRTKAAATYTFKLY